MDRAVDGDSMSDRFAARLEDLDRLSGDDLRSLVHDLVEYARALEQHREDERSESAESGRLHRCLAEQLDLLRRAENLSHTGHDGAGVRFLGERIRRPGGPFP